MDGPLLQERRLAPDQSSSLGLEKTFSALRAWLRSREAARPNTAGGDQPAQAQIVQGQALHQGNGHAVGGEGTQYAGQQGADGGGAAADAVRQMGRQQGR